MRTITWALMMAAVHYAAAPTEADWVGSEMAAVNRYWEFTAMFRDGGLDFRGAPYRPGIYEAVYFRDQGGTPFGFCVFALKTCQAYSNGMIPGGVVVSATYLRMHDRERPVDAIRRFSKRAFRDQDDIDKFGGADDVDPAWSPESLAVKAAPLVLRQIGPPEAVRLRRPLREIARYLQWGDKALFETADPNCTVVTPYADLSYPEIPVLFECPSGSIVQILMRSWDASTSAPYWYPTAGGYIPHGEYVRKIGPIIRKNGTVYRSPSRR